MAKFPEQEMGTDTGENEYTRGKDTSPFLVAKKLEPNRQHFLECYEHRENLKQFLSCLQEKATDPNAWKSVTREPGLKEGFPGLLIRKGDNSVVERDRRRIVALVDAWAAPSGPLEPHYLEMKQIKFVHQKYKRGIKDINDAYEIIKKPAWPAPGGALMNINEGLTNTKEYWRDEYYFFGKYLWEGWGINEYFSALLYWDDRHCFGLIYRINREYGPMAGGIPFTYQAARQWIIEQKERNTVYSRYYIEWL